MNLNLTAAQLRSLLRYDETTGEFTWIAGQRSGMKAGYSVSTLYVTGAWPTNNVDHINGVRSENRFSNLRDVSQAFNVQNQRRPTSANRTNALGVGKKRGKYRARIHIGGKAHHIGTFLTIDEAHAAYVLKKRELHGGCTL